MDDALRRSARRAYESARLSTACLWSLWPLAIAALAVVLGTASPALALSIGVPLTIGVVAARFHGRALGRSVSSALALGTVAFGLAWAAVLLSCADGCAVEGATSSACAASGVCVGAVVGLFMRPRGAGTIAAPLVAGACGALGCAYGGLGAVLGLAAGMAVSTAPWLVWRSLRA